MITKDALEKIEWDAKELWKIRDFIRNIVGQYGKPWDMLSEIQQYSIESDTEKVATGLLFMAQKKIKEALSTLLQQVGEEVEREIIDKDTHSTLKSREAKRIKLEQIIKGVSK